MRVLTILGTRPEIIRLSLIAKKLDRSCEHFVLHTGQNFQENLSKNFFDELGLRQPDRNLEIRGATFGEQLGQLFSRVESVFDEFSPDRVLILGDTNSALVSIVAARRRIPVYHMEAGNRCYDDRVPEEINRRIIDHSSTVLMPYTLRSKENLVREGIERERIFVTGNPIFEVIQHFSADIESSSALSTYSVSANDFFLATIHRAENVDVEENLRSIFAAFEMIVEEFQKDVLVSVHPRTADKLKKLDLTTTSGVRLLDALPFFDFVRLEKSSFMVLTDSGTVQEECSIFGVPNVTVRDVTERPETVECGSNIIGGVRRDTILSAVRIASSSKPKWEPPAEYVVPNVSQIACNIVLGRTSLRAHR